ncbi:histidine phosphatase family protein [Proteus vulgaris]|jgi:probable phosphoglycerate mutase|uniref:Phosphoglycerate mutase n=1 Tax=Proteus vulgaris TaxID=585 RepID=A0A379F429_PROVU|nr:MULTISPECIES: histidine phosphatase family protein [Proteus]NBN61085.1 histidine phosphatase family protein [Proteus sp. G2639]RNT29333.1 histidine phosphatase family protein [Proteus mirabilis]AYY80416.1 histidine phosphatase family protein [Proteus vulgaris]MBG5971543.1 histidine phosphatase family protein [Proteus vulgaris]MBG5983962.1 histidine phosphatase family protein [Proteus vulgaris]
MKKWLIALILAMSTSTSFATETAMSVKGDDGITIYFARHGKTLLNTFDRVQGWVDSPLTEDGIRVARYLGEGLKGIPFDSFYSSDAGRQRETMSVILKQIGIENYKLNELSGLREAFFGGFEGGFNKDMADAGAKQLYLKDATTLFNQMKAGTITAEENQNALAAADPKKMAENYQQVKARTQEALYTIVKNAQEHGDKNILAISSGIAMQIMISDLTDDIAKNKPLSNAAVVKIIYKDGKYTVTEIGTLKYVEIGKQSFAQK